MPDSSKSTRALIDLAFAGADLFREYAARNRSQCLPPEFCRAAEAFAEAVQHEVKQAIEELDPSAERGRVLVALARAGAPRDAGMDYDALDNSRDVDAEVWVMDPARQVYRVRLGATNFLCHYVPALSHWNLSPFRLV